MRFELQMVRGAGKKAEVLKAWDWPGVLAYIEPETDWLEPMPNDVRLRYTGVSEA